ncbi:hypothetical protein [Miltoncostaea marina]|uniref:hypothetical protein n=1 Tax=Miltoncostaea marina TaxID=2843215 RepID=UPI001C3C49E7|nr:hypothetical protein [Miltoncostaea marina]
MTAWVILIGFAVVVAGVVAKVARDVVLHLREDRAAHGGRQTVAAARRAALVIGLVVLLVVVLIVWPLVLGDG